MSISLQRMLERAARVNPYGDGVVYKNETRSWSNVKSRVSRYAALIQQLGGEEGDRIAILSLNSANYYEALFAIPWAGCCVVPLNTRWALPETSYSLEDCEAKLVFFDDAFADQAKELLQKISHLKEAVYIGEQECPEWAIDCERYLTDIDPVPASIRGGDEMAGIFYTGGTTGFPKGVMQSHRAIWASAMSSLPDFKMGPHSRYLHAAPMFHMADLVGSMGAALTSSTNVVLQAFSPDAFLSLVESQKVTHSLIVPAMIKMVLGAYSEADYDVSSLEMIMYGASPMPAATLEFFMRVWPDVDLAQAYGQTELAPIATILPPSDHVAGSKLLRSAGRPTSISEVKCVRADGSECGYEETGEIIVRGPQAMIGYWKKPEETALALRDEWVYTGDAGYIIDSGHLFVVDRVKDMVITGGENVYTTEVENALMTHESVLDVAVIGVPSEEWGEAVHAIVILKQGAETNVESLKEHCRALIAGYKVPKSIAFRSEPLPLSGAGKVLKTELRKPFWETRESQVS